MPSLKNPRHERFAQLIALGTLSQVEAFREAGFSAKSAEHNSLRLRQNEAVAARIEELRKQTEEKLNFAREDLHKFLIDIIKAKPEEASADNPLREIAMSKQGPYWRFPSKLAAAEQLSRICGYNEPEKPQEHNHLHITVDAALIQQLRAGYAQLSERSAKARLPLPSGAGVGGRAPAGGCVPQDTSFARFITMERFPPPTVGAILCLPKSFPQVYCSTSLACTTRTK